MKRRVEEENKKRIEEEDDAMQGRRIPKGDVLAPSK